MTEHVTPTHADRERDFTRAVVRYHQLLAELFKEMHCALCASDALLQAAVSHAASHLPAASRAKMHRLVDDFFEQAETLRATQRAAEAAMSKERPDA